MAKIDFEELKNITSKVNEEKQMKFNQDIENAKQEAIKYIVEGSSDKMKDSSLKGFDKSILYSGLIIKKKDDKSKNKKTEFDSNNVKITFGEKSINILTIIFHDKETFLNELNKEFNNENEQNFNCYYSLKPKYNTDYQILNIFISWRQQDTREQYQSNKNNNFLFNRNNRNNMDRTVVQDKKEMTPKGFSITHVKRNNYL
jgi:hypothetical protein